MASDDCEYHVTDAVFGANILSPGTESLFLVAGEGQDNVVYLQSLDQGDGIQSPSRRLNTNSPPAQVKSLMEVFQCSNCPYICQNIDDLWRHEQECQGRQANKLSQDVQWSDSLTCEICQLEFSAIAELKAHFMNGHAPSMPQTPKNTPSVNIAFKSSPLKVVKEQEKLPASITAMKIVDASKEYKYVCGYCYKICESSSDLEAHVEIHQVKVTISSQSIVKSAEADVNVDTMKEEHDYIVTVNENLSLIETDEDRVIPNYILDVLPLEQLNSSWANTVLEMENGASCYTCRICGDESETSMGFKRHLQTHNITRLKDGESETFESEQESQEDDGMTHGDPSMKRKELEQNLGRKWSTLQEVDPKISEKKRVKTSKVKALQFEKTDDPSAPYKCSACKIMFKQRLELLQHECLKPMNQCQFCDKWFIRPAQLRRHMLIHTKVKPVICSDCHKLFTDTTGLRRHKCNAEDLEFAMSQPVIVYNECAYCLMEAPLEELQNHICPKYDFTNARYGKLQMAPENDHMPFMNQCDFCGLILPNVVSKNNHRRQHTGEKPYYYCAKCQVGFGGVGELEDHKTVCVKSRSTGDEPSSSSNDQPDESVDEYLEKSAPVDPTTMSCGICKKSFPTRFGLMRHMRSHTGERPFRCDVCFRKFAEKGTLKRHICQGERYDEDDDGRTCSYCDRTFATANSRRRHQRIHTNERPYGCKQCRRHFTDSTSLRRHKCVQKDAEEDMMMAGAEGTKCIKCKKDFQSPVRLRRHMLTHISSLLLECSKCKLKFREVNGLKAHVCLDQDPQLCTFCAKPFYCLNALKRHEARHEAHKCSQCCRTFRTERALNKHQREHLKVIECEICNKTFASQQNLRLHKFLHTGLRPFQCTTCGKCFPFKANLKIHMISHNEKKSLKCDQCGKLFLRKSTLKSHMLTHSDDRPYQCPYCSMAFKTHRRMLSHCSVHTGEKNYQCSECDRSFARLSTLRYHEGTHTNTKRGSCSVCGKQFATIAILRKHMQRVHPAMLTSQSSLSDAGVNNKGMVSLLQTPLRGAMLETVIRDFVAEPQPN